MAEYVPPPPLYVVGAEPAIDDSDRRFLAALPGWDDAYEAVYYRQWSGYEEWGWVALLTKGDRFYEIGGGHSVYGDPGDHDRFEPFEVTEEQAIMTIIHWDAVEEWQG